MVEIKERKEALENMVESAGYKMLIERMVADLKATRNNLVVYAGEKESENNNIFKKGQLDKLVYALNLPANMLSELEEE